MAESDDKLAAQLGRGFAAALRQGGGSITLRLQPEALGDLKIRLELSGPQVTARFEAATEQARGLLSESMGSLKSALEARGLEVAGLQVTVGDPPPDRVDLLQQATGDNATSGGTGNDGAGSGRNGSEHPAERGLAAGTRQAGTRPEERVDWMPRDAAVGMIEMGGAPGMHVRLNALA